jgi:hypothetical protein
MLRNVLIVIAIPILGCSIFQTSTPNNSADHPIGILQFDGDTRIVNPKSVDLTEEGQLDWANWGFGAKEWTDRSQYTHKADVTPLIKMDAIIVIKTLKNDSPARVYWSEEPTGNVFSWHDGTPTGTVHELDAGIWMAGVGNGFRISVPANTKRQYITLYLGAWEAEGELTVSLSDKSAPAVTRTFEKAGIDYSNQNVRQYTLEFQASSDNETLTVDWIVKEFYDADGWGNVTLRAVTLSDTM